MLLRLASRRKSGKSDTMAARDRHLFGGCVIVAGQNRSQLSRLCDRSGLVLHAMCLCNVFGFATCAANSAPLKPRFF